MTYLLILDPELKNKNNSVLFSFSAVTFMCQLRGLSALLLFIKFNEDACRS